MHKQSSLEDLISKHSAGQLKKIVPGEYYSWANRKHCAKKNGVAWDERLNDFPDFLRHLGRKPSADATLDRINPTGPYLLDNLRWADKYTQTHNRTNSLSVPAYGRDWPLKMVADRLGFSYQQAYEVFQASGPPELRRLVTHRKFELSFVFPEQWHELFEPQFLQESIDLTRLDWIMSVGLDRKRDIFRAFTHEKRGADAKERVELRMIAEILIHCETHRRWAKHMEREESEGSSCYPPEWGWEIDTSGKPVLGDEAMIHRFRVTSEIFSFA